MRSAQWAARRLRGDHLYPWNPQAGSREPRECENRFYAFMVPFISIDNFYETL